MGNCGTREENAVVAAHAQGILQSLPSDFLGTLVGGALEFGSHAGHFGLRQNLAGGLVAFGSGFPWLVGSPRIAKNDLFPSFFLL